MLFGGQHSAFEAISCMDLDVEEGRHHIIVVHVRLFSCFKWLLQMVYTIYRVYESLL